MATLHVVIASVSDRAVTGSTLPIPPAKTRVAKTLTTSATSAADADLVASEGEVWIVTARDADHWVEFGDGNQTAGPAASIETAGGYLVMSGTTREFGADAAQKIAVRTA